MIRGGKVLRRGKLNVLCRRQQFNIGIMTRFAPMFLPKNRQQISLEDMNYFFENIQKLFVACYDGEGCLMWDVQREGWLRPLLLTNHVSFYETIDVLPVRP